MMPQCRARMNEYENNQHVTQPLVDIDKLLKQILVTRNEVRERE